MPNESNYFGDNKISNKKSNLRKDSSSISSSTLSDSSDFDKSDNYEGKIYIPDWTYPKTYYFN
jgi:hypothetical protein